MIKILPLLCLFFFASPVWSQPDTLVQNDRIDISDSLDKMMKMSIEELLGLEVKVSSLTKLKQQNTPASITTITEQDIAVTPARNVYDLIETFVPGAIWVNHYDGPHLGVRFAPSDRNYKYILLVDGVNLNQKSLNGMSSELDNWDIDDIQRIEVVRGPGSVTFGPGATMGVINIVTKKATKHNEFTASGKFVSPYNARGANTSYSFSKNLFKVYAFASVMELPGYQNADMFRVEQDKETKKFYSGYIGKDMNYIYGQNVGNAPPLSYLRSEKPQVKLHLGINFAKEWDLMIRYTTSDMIGQYSYPQIKPVAGVQVEETMMDSTGVHRQGTVKWGKYTDYGYVKHHVFSTALKNIHSFGDNFELSSKLSWYSHDFEFGWNDYYFKHNQNFDTIVKYNELGSMVNPINKTTELGRNWSENELCLTEIMNWTPTSRSKFALGFEVSNTSVQKGWGDNNNEMIAGESWDFVSDANSVYVQKNENQLYSNSKPLNKLVLIGDGFTVRTHSAMAEANVQLSRKLTLLVSGRADKNSYIKWLLSPRAALIAEINQQHNVKLLVQRSQRMNTLGQLYLEKQSNTESDNESLTSFEAIYNLKLNKHVTFTLPLFYNIVDNLGVERSAGDVAKIATSLIGRYTCWGLEPEIRFSWQKVDAGVNHSFYVPLAWTLSDKSDGRNITSVGDWDYTTQSGLHLTSSTANLMCWSNQTSKLWLNVRFCKKFSAHLDARCYWAFEGGKDMLTMWNDAAKGTSQEQDVKAVTNQLEQNKVYGTDLRLNAGLSYQLLKSTTFSVSCMNLISSTNNKRYSLWEFWNEYPTMAYVKEPLMVTAKLQIKL